MKNRFNILPDRPEEGEKGMKERGGGGGGGGGGVVGVGRFPSWLHRKLPKGEALWQTSKILGHKGVHTVCEEARCPNLLECWSKKTATFLVMGKQCTRSCGFCSIDHSKTPLPLEADEPQRVAESALALDLEHVVITMVARDDLPDGGASHLMAIVEMIRKKNPQMTIEILTSDFEGKESSLDRVIEAHPDIFNHNVETVERLTSRVRHKATYSRSLKVLSYMKPFVPLIKSGFMVGLGETREEVLATLNDLKEVGVHIVTIGQYLQSDRHKLRVKSFIHPDLFKEYAEIGHSIGIPYVYSAPFVRSSYNAKDVFLRA